MSNFSLTSFLQGPLKNEDLLYCIVQETLIWKNLRNGFSGLSCIADVLLYRVSQKKVYAFNEP